MNVATDLTTVNSNVPILLDRSLAPVMMGFHWTQTNGHALKTQLNRQKMAVEVDSLLLVVTSNHQGGLQLIPKKIFGVNGSLIFQMMML